MLPCMEYVHLPQKWPSHVASGIDSPWISMALASTGEKVRRFSGLQEDLRFLALECPGEYFPSWLLLRINRVRLDPAAKSWGDIGTPFSDMAGIQHLSWLQFVVHPISLFVWYDIAVVNQHRCGSRPGFPWENHDLHGLHICPASSAKWTAKLGFTLAEPCGSLGDLWGKGWAFQFLPRLMGFSHLSHRRYGDIVGSSHLGNHT